MNLQFDLANVKCGGCANSIRKAVEAMPDRGKTDCIWIFLGAPAGSVAPFVLGAANTEKAVKESRCYTVPRGDGGWWTGTFPDYKPLLGHLFDKKRVPASRQGLPDSMMWGALVSPDGKQHTDVMPRFVRLLANSEHTLVFLDDTSLVSRRAE